ncbi:MAG: hypothetical protein AAF500_00415 [Myxococcota bacterium]
MAFLSAVAPTALAETAAVGPEVATERARPRFSYEVRAQIFNPSYRWSDVGSLEYPHTIGAKSLYFSPGLGFRLISAAGHAVIVDGDYRFDADFDGYATVEDSFPIRFGVAHAGYAYRHITRLRPPSARRRSWTVAPHAAFSAGVARKMAYRGLDGIPGRSPVIGARVGLDLDLHFRSFFLGWSLSYEFLHHISGGLTRSNFLTWNFIPLFRMGVNFGRKVQ